jgi:iron complex transport system permease protein
VPLRRLRPRTLALALLTALPLLAFWSLHTGPVELPPRLLWRALLQPLTGADAGGSAALILFELRLPRIVLAAAVGAVLASSGAVMQGLFRNPLADPSLIGVSSGASVGAALVIVAAGPLLEQSAQGALSLVAAGAFAGGFLASLLVYRLATGSGGTSVATMLLAGIAIGALAGALHNLLGYFADNDMLRQISLWQMGSLSSATWPRALLAAAVAALLLAAFPRDSAALNALLLGESQARYLGIDVQRVKRRLILLTALGVGVSVAAAGLVAFVGLVIPHLVRLLIGPDHRGLVPCAALAGALLLLAADNLARVLVAPAELPTGVLTALLGAPFFVLLLAQQRVRV